MESGRRLGLHAMPILAGSFALHGASDLITRASAHVAILDPEVPVVLLATGVPGFLASVATARYLHRNERSASPLALFPLIGARLATVLLTFVYLMVVYFVGALLLIVPGLIAVAGFAVATPVVAVEATTASGALRRSWELTRGRRMRALALVLVTLTPLFAFPLLRVEGLAHALLVTAAYCPLAAYSDVAAWVLYEELARAELPPDP